MIRLSLALALTLSLLSSFSLAASQAQSTFETQIQEIQNYEVEFETVDIDLSDLDKQLRSTLEQIANHEKDVWYDTILEGDYILSLNGQTSLQAVTAYYVNARLVAYQIFYSHPAWYLGDCEYDDEVELTSKNEDEVLKQCSFGHISSGCFASPDLSMTVFDSENPESFD